MSLSCNDEGTFFISELYVPPPPSPLPTESSADSNEISDDVDVTPALIDTEPAFVFLGEDGEAEASDEADGGKKPGVAGGRHANRAKTFFAAASSAEKKFTFATAILGHMAVVVILTLGFNY